MRYVKNGANFSARPASQTKLRLSTLSADLPSGLQSIFGGEGQWRVLLSTPIDGSRIAVSQCASCRDEIAHGAGDGLIKPAHA
jgi:hypothetical protein